MKWTTNLFKRIKDYIYDEADYLKNSYRAIRANSVLLI